MNKQKWRLLLLHYQPLTKQNLPLRITNKNKCACQGICLWSMPFICFPRPYHLTKIFIGMLERKQWPITWLKLPLINEQFYCFAHSLPSMKRSSIQIHFLSASCPQSLTLQQQHFFSGSVHKRSRHAIFSRAAVTAVQSCSIQYSQLSN